MPWETTPTCVEARDLLQVVVARAATMEARLDCRCCAGVADAQGMLCVLLLGSSVVGKWWEAVRLPEVERMQGQQGCRWWAFGGKAVGV